MKNFLVIGLGEFGKSVAKTLYKGGATVLAIDSSEELVNNAIDEKIVAEAIILDATDEVALRNVVRDDFDTAFVCLGSSIQNSILVTLHLKEMGINHIICKAVSHTQGKVLEKVGASEIIYAEELMGERLAYRVLKPTVIEHFRFSSEYSVIELEMPESYVGKSLMELDLRNKFEANVMAIKYSDGKMNVTPDPRAKLNKDEVIIILVKTELVDELIK